MAKTKTQAPTDTLDAAAETAPQTPTTDANGLGHADYKLAGEIPEALRGKLIRTKDCNGDLNKMHLLVEDGKPENVARLAQAQYDIIVQRQLRGAATSDEVAGILAGKVVEVDGESQDFSGLSDEDRLAYAVDRIQAVADDYRYGARPLIAGGGTKAAKAALQDKTKIMAAAASDPELAAKLAALGITL